MSTCDGLLSEPVAMDLRDDQEAPRADQQVERVALSSYRNTSSAFVLPEKRDYERQYSNLYFSRLMTMAPLVQQRAHAKWDHLAPHFCKSILELKEGQHCVIFGTVYKDMRLKPNILDEYYAREHYEAPPPERSKYCGADDKLVLEDQTGRAVLSGKNIPVDQLVTGVVLAVIGREVSSGEFEVEDYTPCDFAPQAPLKPPTEDAYVCLVSGFSISTTGKTLLPLQIFVDYVTGQLGSIKEQQFVSRIARVIIAGNLIGEVKKEKAEEIAEYARKNLDPDTVGYVKELDDFIAQIASSVPVDMMPGPNDPSNHIVPQQPLHRCMFPIANKVKTTKGVTNPYSFELEGVSFLGTSGQGVDDIYRFCATEDRLAIMENTLRWSHLFPTAPDTLGCFPYVDKHKDPFVIQSLPHIYFAGNQPAFQTKLLDAGDAVVRIIAVPTFASTHSAVLVNLRTLDCEEIHFNVEDL